MPPKRLVQGDATEERALGAEVEFGGSGMVGDEAFFFALLESEKAGAIDGGHRWFARDSRGGGRGKRGEFERVRDQTGQARNMQYREQRKSSARKGGSGAPALQISAGRG